MQITLRFTNSGDRMLFEDMQVDCEAVPPIGAAVSIDSFFAEDIQEGIDDHEWGVSRVDWRVQPVLIGDANPRACFEIVVTCMAKDEDLTETSPSADHRGAE